MLEVLETANMHHVPSAEMPDFHEGQWFIAELDGAVVGVSGHTLLEVEGERVGKTKLLAVVPPARKLGVGRTLQELRMRLMREAGASRVITNADRPETIAWYIRRFGYREVGEVPKQREFGHPGIARWTTLEAPLDGPSG